MKIEKLLRFLNFRDLRSALVGAFVVFGGIGLSALTIVAHRSGELRLAGLAALLSLVFVLLIIIFVVPPLARNATAEVAQMDLPIDMTVGGLIFFGLLVIVGFAAWNTGNNLLFLVLSFLLSAFIVSTVFGAMSIRGLEVRLRLPEFIFAGDEIPIKLVLVNRKRFFPTYSVLVELRGTERDDDHFVKRLSEMMPKKIAERLGRAPIIKHTIDHVVTVTRRSQADHEVLYVFERRGKFSIRDFELSTNFPFGLFRHRRRLGARETDVLIYPNVQKTLQIAVNESEGGNQNEPRKDCGDFYSTREYQVTDDVRTIEWKASARTGKLMVRETADNEREKFVIFVDDRVIASSDMFEPKMIRRRLEMERDGERLLEEQEFESMLSRAASLVVELIEAGNLVGLSAGSVEVGYGEGKAHMHECLRTLALLCPRFVETSDESPHASSIDSSGAAYIRFSMIEASPSDVDLRGI